MPIGKPPCCSSQGRSNGFTYLLLLFVLAIGAAGLAALGENHRVRTQRARETELVFRGTEIARAIASYAAASPAGTRTLPLSLDELLEDRRDGAVRRHLRQRYVDPFTGRSDWVLVGAGASAGQALGISAVHSRSDRSLLRGSGRSKPLRASELLFRQQAYAAVFVVSPGAASAATGGE